MAWTTPVSPVAGTVITVAYAASNIVGPTNHLRTMTGAADPPGSGYVVTSDSAAATSWKAVGTAVTAGLGYTPANKAGDTFTGPVSAASPILAIALGGVNGGQFVWGATGSTFGAVADVASSVWRLFNASDGSKILFFNLLTGKVTGVNQFEGTQFVSTATGATPPFVVSSTAEVTNLRAATATLANTATSAATAALATTATNASAVIGKTPTATPTADAIPIADGSGTLDAWVTPASFSIPSGLGFYVRKAADIPSGFTRDTTLDGLIPVGAGTTFSQTFVEETAYGSSWAHTHSQTSVAVTVSSVTVTGSAVGGPGDATGTNSASGQSAGTGTSRADDPHTHSLNGVSLAVSASGTGSGTTGTGTSGSTTYLPPSRAVVWCRKN